ncbi:MAG: hypothetical protein MUE85_00290 [Microscillaceae bacterium]|jgi:hypothetical protein|nr:hypothetical protein [Microscillaceae bacterium]
MAQFVSFDSESKVSGKMICSMLDAVPAYENKIKMILSKYSLDEPDPQQWYEMQDFLSVFKDISKLLGPHLLFAIGKNFPVQLLQNGEVQSLENALRDLDSLYHDHHRGDSVSYYKLISFSQDRKEAKIECKNPYPCYLDRGILTSITQKYKPRGASLVNVELDNDRPSRLGGSDVSYYTIMWV